MANISFGKRLQRARIRNAITQAELGEKIGVLQAIISNWECDKSKPDAGQKKNLERILGGLTAKKQTDQEAEEPEVSLGVLGTWLNRVRLEKGMSVAELAEAAKLSVPVIYSIESGRISNPRAETIQKLEKALKRELSKEAKEEIREEAIVGKLGELCDFDPHNKDDFPSEPGIYVLYDKFKRPSYIGQGQDIKKRICDHMDKFWFKQPVVVSAAYVRIEDKVLRRDIEALLIRFLNTVAVINKQHTETGNGD